MAAEIQLTLLLHLDVATEASVWRRVDGAQIECILTLGADTTSRRIRAAAKAACSARGGLSLVGQTSLRAAQVQRFGAPAGAVVIRVFGDPRRDVTAYLEAATAALAPVLEREHLLERDAGRERALVAAGEKRLMRLGFDLHDGPVQDVLALAGETRRLRDQIYPFVLETHRDLAFGRFDDMLARLSDLDRGLRGVAHSLETKSVVARPLSEIIHREVDTFESAPGSRRPSMSVAIQSRSARRSGSPSSGLCRNPLRTSESTAVPRKWPSASGRAELRSTSASPTTARASRYHGRWPARRSVGDSVSSVSVSAFVCSAARSRSTVVPAARQPCVFSLPRWEPFSRVDDHSTPR